MDSRGWCLDRVRELVASRVCVVPLAPQRAERSRGLVLSDTAERLRNDSALLTASYLGEPR